MARWLGALSILFAVGCIFQIGPAHPDRDAPKYLKRQGYSQDVIKKVLAMEDVGEDLFARLAAEKSTDVRFLIAQNPRLPKHLHEKLIGESNDFVRGGAALSPHLTEEQIAVEIKKGRDNNHTVLLYIARNPHVSKQTLVDLHEKHGMDLVWFAQNPACPEELAQKMQATNDKDALYWLRVTREQEAYKKQQREQQERANKQ